MRHNKKFNHLGRQRGHRKAMLANMAMSLIQYKRISTTIAKAKALKMFIEPIITKAKDDSTHSRRVVFSYLRSKEATAELFREIAPRIANRPGGYTRVLKTGFRLGDAADMCIIEFVDFNETYSVEGTAAAKPKTRRSRTATKKDETVVVEGAEAPAADAKAPAKKAAPKKAAAAPKPVQAKMKASSAAKAAPSRGSVKK